jgi:fatty-acyl-CoA synthase
MSQSRATHAMTFPDLTWRRARLNPDDIAIVDTGRGEEQTYAELEARASALAAFLRDDWGIQAGDRIAIIAMNGAPLLELLFACAKIGALLVPLNWRLAIPELTYILDDCAPRALVHGPEFAEVARDLREAASIDRALGLDDDGETIYADALEAGAGAAIHMPDRAHDDVWGLLYTSGTTGRPKGVIQTFGMITVNHLNIGLPIGLTGQDKTLNLLPQFHTGGLNLHTLPTLIAGGTAIVQRAFEPDETLRLLAERTTAFFGVPAVYQALRDHPDFAQSDLSGVRSWASGGAPMPVAVIRAYADRGITIRQGFGMTETGPTVFLIDEANALTKAGSVGKPQLFVEVKIVDRDGQEVGPGEGGELLVRGPGVTPGYWQQPDVTAETIEPDGWLHSGDVARRDEDGYYTIVDRWKDMFISGGENVYPAEVENVLHDHPEIADVAVVGIPDEKWGEVGLAVVVPASDPVPTANDVAAFCADRLARYKIPRRVEVVDELPRNAAGKILKGDLRDRFVP